MPVVFWNPGGVPAGQVPPRSLPAQNEKEGAMGYFLDPLYSPKGSSVFFSSVDCCLRVFKSFFTRRGEWKMLAVRSRHFTSHEKLGHSRKGLLSLLPAFPQQLSHVATHRLIVVYCCFCFPLPWLWRKHSKAAKRRRGVKNFKTAVPVVSSPNGDTWRLLIMATAYRQSRGRADASA